MNQPNKFFSEVYDPHFHTQLTHRSYSIRFALILFMYNKGKTIIETGTTRYADHFGDGQFAKIVGELAKYYDCSISSVDIELANVNFATNYLSSYANVKVVLDDSVHFLQHNEDKIDLLYLDSLDCPTIDDAKISQTHNLNELKAAEKNLHEKSIIMIDDAKLPSGGKAQLTNEYLLDKGWFSIPFEYQNVYIKINE